MCVYTYIDIHVKESYIQAKEAYIQAKEAPKP